MHYYKFQNIKIVLTVALIIICNADSLMSQGTKLLVRADDLGASRSINLAIIDTYKNGITRSAEVMVPGPWFEEAVVLANENPGLDIGVHITLTSEWSNIKWRPLTQAKSITDENGYFFPFVWPNKDYPGGSIMESNWNIDDIEKEVRAQIETVLKRIPHVSHISAHMGCLRFSDETVELLYRLAEEYDLYVIDAENSNINGFPGWSGNEVSKSQKLENMTGILESLESGTYLLVEHPAYDNLETQGMGHIGYENVAEDREGVTYVFNHEEVKNILIEKNIELISYKDLIKLNGAANSVEVVNLTCDYISNPLLVNSNSPGFGWQIEAIDDGFVQSAYQIEIYSDLIGKSEIVWDSKKVYSNQNQGVKIDIPGTLEPGRKYHWRVRVWDKDGNISEWSDYNSFRIAPCDMEKNGKWIGAIRHEDSNIPEGRNYHGLSLSSEDGIKWQETHPLSERSIYLRKDFSTNKEIKDAIIYISGLGHYELTLNGEILGDSQFDPMWSDYDKTVYYNAYDITDQLENENAIGVLLGNGFYNQQGGRYVKMQVSFGPPTLFFKMNITYTDGSTEEITSDETWKYSLSPLVFNDMYGGEDYDAQLEQPGWDSYGFDDSEWKPVVIQDAPKGKLTPQTTFPIKIMERYSAQSVKRVGDAYVYDMGQNLSGFPKIKVSGNKGDKIRLTLGENIFEDGSVNQSQSGSPYYFEYTLKGDDEEIWQPRFSYYGYRYIQIDGAKPESNRNDDRGLPVVKDIESLFVYNSNPETSTFYSSNEIFNNTHRLIVNAMKSNMHAVFTDCPHREKLGWLEQVHLNGPGLFYNFNLTTFAPKIMQDIRDSQLANGLVPDIAPEYVVFVDGFRDSPEWGSTSVILPFMYYEYYGDNSLITDYYDVMKRYVDYLTSTATNHIVYHGLGDWCDYREDQPYGISHNTPVALSASTHYYMVIDYLVKAAEITGNKEDEQHYSKLRDEVRDAFNREFFDEKNMTYGTGSQASNSMPLFAGIVERENRDAVLQSLVKNIEERGYRLSTGDVGNRYLFQTLAENDLNDLMYKMHNHEDVPGYGFQLQFGATTLTELWDPRAGASWNHFMMGQIEEWFFKSLAGIRSEGNSGYKNIVIAPKPVGDLKFVEASYESIYGKIDVNWRNENGTFNLSVSVPANCSAKIFLPDDNESIEVGSGSYNFTKEM